MAASLWAVDGVSDGELADCASVSVSSSVYFLARVFDLIGFPTLRVEFSPFRLRFHSEMVVCRRPFPSRRSAVLMAYC